MRLLLENRVSAPFCDALRVSYALADAETVWGEVSHGLTACGYGEREAGILRAGLGDGQAGLFKYPGTGTVWLSGSCCGDLRAAGEFEGLLAGLSGRPHAATRLDAACDFRVDGPEWVSWLLARGLAGDLRVGGRRVKPERVTTFMGLGPDGRTTGTVYGGKRGSAAQLLRVYDKRAQLVWKGHADPGPLLRVEFEVSREKGCTLRDAASPERLFYHLADPGWMEVPNVGDWSPHAEGRVLPERAKYSAEERLAMMVRRSPEISRMLKLTLEIGAGGLTTLNYLLRAQHEVVRESAKLDALLQRQLSQA